MTSPRAEATAATRAGLVEAATELFAARGFAETSIDDVAAVAGMTKGAVYHHFAGQGGAVRGRVLGPGDGGARAAGRGPRRRARPAHRRPRRAHDVPRGLHRADVRADRLPRRAAGARVAALAGVRAGLRLRADRAGARRARARGSPGPGAGSVLPGGRARDALQRRPAARPGAARAARGAARGAARLLRPGAGRTRPAEPEPSTGAARAPGAGPPSSPPPCAGSRRCRRCGA